MNDANKTQLQGPKDFPQPTEIPPPAMTFADASRIRREAAAMINFTFEDYVAFNAYSLMHSNNELAQVPGWTQRKLFQYCGFNRLPMSDDSRKIVLAFFLEQLTEMRKLTRVAAQVLGPANRLTGNWQDILAEAWNHGLVIF